MLHICRCVAVRPSAVALTRSVCLSPLALSYKKLNTVCYVVHITDPRYCRVCMERSCVRTRLSSLSHWSKPPPRPIPLFCSFPFPFCYLLLCPLFFSASLSSKSIVTVALSATVIDSGAMKAVAAVPPLILGHAKHENGQNITACH